MRNHSYANDFDLLENETACRIHFHMKGFALKHVLKQSHTGVGELGNGLSVRVAIKVLAAVACRQAVYM